jgi:4-hydroxy-tetrahydrodipicolinate synthase
MQTTELSAMIQGTLTAMVTPFRNDQVDWPRLNQQVKLQVRSGIDGLVPVGTTGESPTLSHAEHRRVIEEVVKAAAGKVKVVAGTGSNATSEALELTQFARQVGADAVLSVVPYYNKPTQEGMYRHFMALADGADIPTILYNIPGRCGVTMTPATVARLAKHPNIVGIKEATGSIDIASEIACLCDARTFVILSGDDSLTLPLISVGARGVISVLSNLVPRRVRALVEAGLKGDMARARKLHLELFPLFRAMFLETNPTPIKTAMALAGLDSGEMRLPLCPMSENHRQSLAQVLRDYKIVKK